MDKDRTKSERQPLVPLREGTPLPRGESADLGRNVSRLAEVGELYDYPVREFPPKREDESREEFLARDWSRKKTKMMVALVSESSDPLSEQDFRIRRIERRQIHKWLGKMDSESFLRRSGAALKDVETPMDREEGSEKVRERLAGDTFALDFVFRETRDAWKDLPDAYNADASEDSQREMEAVALAAFYKKFPTAADARKAEAEYIDTILDLPDFEQNREKYLSGYRTALETIYGAQESYMEAAEELRSEGMDVLAEDTADVIPSVAPAAETSKNPSAPSAETPKSVPESAPKIPETYELPEISTPITYYPRVANRRAAGGGFFGNFRGAVSGKKKSESWEDVAARREKEERERREKEEREAREAEEAAFRRLEELTDGKLRRIDEKKKDGLMSWLTKRFRERVKREGIKYDTTWPSETPVLRGQQRPHIRVVPRVEAGLGLNSMEDKAYSIETLGLAPEVELKNAEGEGIGVFASKMFLMRDGRPGMYLFETRKSDRDEEITATVLSKSGGRWKKVEKFVRPMGRGRINWSGTEPMMTDLDRKIEDGVNLAESQAREIGIMDYSRTWDDSEALVAAFATREVTP